MSNHQLLISLILTLTTSIVGQDPGCMMCPQTYTYCDHPTGPVAREQGFCDRDSDCYGDETYCYGGRQTDNCIERLGCYGKAHWTTFTTDEPFTWKAAQSFCERTYLNGRLCHCSDYCDGPHHDQHFKFEREVSDGYLHSGDHWAPCYGDENEWIHVSTLPHHLCTLHVGDFKSAPEWGLTGSHYGREFCCTGTAESRPEAHGSEDDVECCADIGFFCGDGGCACDHCCGSPWDRSNKGCCKSNKCAPDPETEHIVICNDDIRCNKNCYSRREEFFKAEGDECLVGNASKSVGTNNSHRAAWSLVSVTLFGVLVN